LIPRPTLSEIPRHIVGFMMFPPHSSNAVKGEGREKREQVGHKIRPWSSIRAWRKTHLSSQVSVSMHIYICNAIGYVLYLLPRQLLIHITPSNGSWNGLLSILQCSKTHTLCFLRLRPSHPFHLSSHLCQGRLESSLPPWNDEECRRHFSIESELQSLPQFRGTARHYDQND
jgi:hypothetical protein